MWPAHDITGVDVLDDGFETDGLERQVTQLVLGEDVDVVEVPFEIAHEIAQAKTARGSRALQQILESHDHVPDDLWGPLSTKFCVLMKDPYGNYICQKVIERCTQQQIDELAELVQLHGIVDLAQDRYSTRALQLLITKLASGTKVVLISIDGAG
jgi:hypothetical protein